MGKVDYIIEFKYEKYTVYNVEDGARQYAGEEVWVFVDDFEDVAGFVLWAVTNQKSSKHFKKYIALSCKPCITALNIYSILPE